MNRIAIKHPRTLVWATLAGVWVLWATGLLGLARPLWAVLVTLGLPVILFACSIVGFWVTGLRWTSWLTPVGDLLPALWKVWNSSNWSSRKGPFSRLRKVWFIATRLRSYIKGLHYVVRDQVEAASYILCSWKETNTELHLPFDPAMICTRMWSDGHMLKVAVRPVEGLTAKQIEAKAEVLANKWDMNVQAAVINGSQVVFTCTQGNVTLDDSRHADLDSKL